MNDDDDEDSIGHICVYLFDQEIHIDVQSDGGVLDLELLSSSLGQLLTHAIVQHFTEKPDANIGQSPVVRVH